MLKNFRIRALFDPWLRFHGPFKNGLKEQGAFSALELESLEERALLSASFPTNVEQYMVELINKARAMPSAYAASLGIALNEGLAANSISTASKQPLAINPYLTDAAAQHSQWMLDVDKFSHTGASGSSPTERVRAAGYALLGSWRTGENIGYRGTTGTPNVTAFTKALEEALFIDAGISNRGHRLNILNDTFAEVGVGIRSGKYSAFNAVMATQDFAKSGNAVYLTGVAFADTVAVDRFYTPGEGLANLSIEAIRDDNGNRYSTKTWSSGGYRLELPSGRYSIWASGAALGSAQFIASVDMGTQNVKRDFVRNDIRIAPEIAVIGNNWYIANKDVTPRTADHTDFGGVAVVNTSLNKTFSIANIGNGTLNLTGSPRVSVSGLHAADFVVVAQPGASIAASSKTSFTIRFNPSAVGLRTAVMTIKSNDANENPFSFTVAGTGAGPAALAQNLVIDTMSRSGDLSDLARQDSTLPRTPESYVLPTAPMVLPGGSPSLRMINVIDFSKYSQLFSWNSIQAIGSWSLLQLRTGTLFRI